MSLQVSPRLQNKVALVAEVSRGPLRIVLVLKDGRRIRPVIVSRNSVIERVCEREIKEEKDLEFPMAQIQDLDIDIA
jgi:hypothetical protein